MIAAIYLVLAVGTATALFLVAELLPRNGYRPGPRWVRAVAALVGGAIWPVMLLGGVQVWLIAVLVRRRRVVRSTD